MHVSVVINFNFDIYIYIRTHIYNYYYYNCLVSWNTQNLSIEPFFSVSFSSPVHLFNCFFNLWLQQTTSSHYSSSPSSILHPYNSLRIPKMSLSSSSSSSSSTDSSSSEPVEAREGSAGGVGFEAGTSSSSRSRRRGGNGVWPEPFVEALAYQVAIDAATNNGRLAAAPALASLFQVRYICNLRLYYHMRGMLFGSCLIFSWFMKWKLCFCAYRNHFFFLVAFKNGEEWWKGFGP